MATFCPFQPAHGKAPFNSASRTESVSTSKLTRASTAQIPRKPFQRATALLQRSVSQNSGKPRYGSCSCSGEDASSGGARVGLVLASGWPRNGEAIVWTERSVRRQRWIAASRRGPGGALAMRADDWDDDAQEPQLDGDNNNSPKQKNGKEMSVIPLSDAALGLDPEEQPWLGAILFRRSNQKTHYEFQTTLERLSLSKFCSVDSEKLAHTMGIRASADGEGGTPVNVSCDVERRGNDIVVAGLVRTAIALRCKRCLNPAAARIFADFDLVLTSTPVQEPTQRSLGVVLGLPKRHTIEGADDASGPQLDLDFDDKLYFPPESREMDLSKYVRDVIHLEAPMGVVCKASCRGLCFYCGANLNEESCRCKRGAKDSKSAVQNWGVLEQLKTQMEESSE